MIEKIRSQSRTTEVDALTILILAAYNSSSVISDTHLSSVMSVTQTLSKSLNTAINHMASVSTLEEKDALRDDAIRSFYYLLQGYCHHTDSSIKDAAKNVMAVFNNYGLNIVSDSYAVETSLINSLLSDLSSDEIIINIALLSGIAESIEVIKTTQNDFEVSSLLYEQTKVSERTKESATNIKKQVIQHINTKLVVYMQAMMLVDEANYSDFGNVLNQIISDNNIRVKMRANSASDKIVANKNTSE
jgi:hypothetical protein